MDAEDGFLAVDRHADVPDVAEPVSRTERSAIVCRVSAFIPDRASSAIASG